MTDTRLKMRRFETRYRSLGDRMELVFEDNDKNTATVEFPRGVASAMILAMGDQFREIFNARTNASPERVFGITKLSAVTLSDGSAGLRIETTEVPEITFRVTDLDLQQMEEWCRAAREAMAGKGEVKH